MSNIDKQALRSTSERDWFEDWFKREFHPDKTGPYIKDQLFFAVRAARAPLLDELEALKLALASLEAEPVAWLLSGGGAKNNVSFDSGNAYADPLRDVTPLYTAPPAQVSVPDESAIFDAAIDICRKSDAIDEHAWNHGVLAVMSAFSDCRAAMLKHSEPFIVTSDHRMMEMPQVEAINAVTAMLQGADRPQNEPQNIPENIPATQFKPVADLYGLTSPTGGETSFTFDAVEARDFIDGGWSCQEYVELGRFQEAMLQNGNSPAQSDCCPEQNYIAPAQDGDSPVIPDGWVLVPEEPTHEMLEAGDEQFGTYDVYRRMIAASPQQK
ncbi:hypothetical protein UXO29_17705 [Enterobacter hormaechei]